MKPFRTKYEESLQIAVSTYLKHAYPDVIFTSESSGIRLTMGQAVKAKKQRSVGSLPDMIILEPCPKGIYHGLCLELKQLKNSPYLKSGRLSEDKHVQEQAQMLRRLEEKGYMARFAIGFENAKSIIDDYLKKP